MQLCPVSYALGCKKCPLFKVCPGKSIIGDAKPSDKKSSPQKKQEDE